MIGPIEIRANDEGDAREAAFPLIDQAEPMFGADTAAAIGLADAAAEISGVLDSSAEAMLDDVLGGGADAFDRFCLVLDTREPTLSAPALPADFVDNDHDGLG